MLAYSSSAPTFDNCVIPSPPAHPMHSTERRRPPLKAPHPNDILKCPRCDSLDTKFCYYNNYSLAQPRYFCKNCKRYWTSGGTLRNVPVGGGLRKNKRSKLKLAAEADAAMAAAQVLAKAEAVTLPDAGRIEYEGKAIATTSHPPPAETMAKVENHVAKAMPSGIMYAHTMPAITSPFKVGGYAGALALNYGTGGEELSGSSAIVVSSEQERAGTVYRDNDQQAMASIYNGQLEPQLCSSYAGLSSLPNTGRHGQLRNIVGEGYTVNYKFMESGAIPVKGEQPISCAGDQYGDGNSESEGPITSKRVRMMDQQESDDGGVGAEGSGGGSATTYDWQVLSEGIFNGGSNSGSSSFFYIPSSSWPDDFCQFSDTGPG